MYPELFQVFGLKITTWGVMLLIGFIAAFFMVKARAKKFGIPQEKVIDLVLYSMLAGIIGGRIVFILIEWESYSGNWTDIFNVQQGGMTSFGGYLFGLIAMTLWARFNKVSLLRTLDLIIVPAFLVLVIGRIGCFFNGCCFGAECDLPWAVHFPEVPGDVHPAQLYDSLMVLGSMGVLLFMERRSFRASEQGPWLGQLISVGLILLGITRYIYEIFRAGASSEIIYQQANLTLAQIAAIAIAVIGVAMYLVLRGRRVEAPV